MKVYLAGPMSGIPEFNFPAFHAAAAKLRAEGHEVFNPAEKDIERVGRDFSKDYPTGDAVQLAWDGVLTKRECLATDTNWICKHAEAIALLPGWLNSTGACAEVALAKALGLQVLVLAESFDFSPEAFTELFFLRNHKFRMTVL